MKKVYILIAMLLIASVTMAQIQPRVDHLGNTVKVTKTIKVNQGTGIKAVIDTAGWSANYTPQFGAPLAEAHVYGMVDASDNWMGYWFGTSGDAVADSLESDYWAQCWVSTGTVKIAGVLFFAAGKSVMVGGTGSTVQMGIQNMSDPTGCITDVTTTPYTFGPAPSATYLASGTMNIADVDTNWLAFNYIPFTTMPTVAGDFCAVSNFKAMRVNGDTCYMMCDGLGNGLTLHFSQYCMNPATYYWVSCAVSTLDVNISLFAVIDDGASITDEGYFQGMKMSIRNNPAKENTFVDYYLQYSSAVKLFVYDITGKEILVINEGNKAAGVLNSVSINTCDLKSGNYFVSLAANGGRFTKKLVVE